ncbi:type I polyketide synthase [Aspergillus stella-maris]|uniref:type I polyketide synthase n=1 Tax=Aspergillus stella-maris TaxID=1810926 RepID=UPI003CCD9A96
MPVEPIAILGTGCRFPGQATAPARLWELLSNPRDVASGPPPDRWDAASFYHENPSHPGTLNAKEAYFLSENPLHFDSAFFNISSFEAASMDPQQRGLLETVFEALEAAGLRIDQLRGSSTGVFCGQMGADWPDFFAADHQVVPTHSATGSARSIVANRVSYFFDWHGPSVVVDTACSSSLVALHQAVLSLQQRECSVAIAAGTNLLLGPSFFVVTTKMSMLSPDGRGRMWDADANGYARGEGIAAVVLKRLSDALADGDPIECVVRATSVNQDGHTQGLTIPSSTAQLQLIESTYANAGLDPRNPRDRCQYFEAHGTGTLVGDPQEASAIYRAFFGDPPGDNGAGYSDDDMGVEQDVLHVGSIKTVVGHTEGLAGLAGIIKASLSLQNKKIAPNLLFDSLNPALTPYTRHLRVPTAAIPWASLPHGVPRRVSVNSFGFGGTNAHAILESYEPGATESNGKEDVVNGVNGLAGTPSMVLPFTFSAAAGKSLANVLESYGDFIQNNPDLSPHDLAATLIQRKSALRYRLAISAGSLEELQAKITAGLEATKRKEQLPFILERKNTSSNGERYILGIFNGQGAQWAQMGHDLISICPPARKWMAQMQHSLDTLPEQYKDHSGPKAHTISLLDELGDACANLHRPNLSQPLCTALQIVQVRFLTSLGIRFKAVIGHSSGETAAAYAAGFINAHDAIRIAYLRGRAAAWAGTPNGRETIGNSENGIGNRNGNDQAGAMLAAGISPEEADALCARDEFQDQVVLAASNAPLSVTLSGDAEAVCRLEQLLKSEGKFARLLHVDAAYHSHHMKRAAPEYLRSMQGCNIRALAPKERSTAEPKWYSTAYPGVRMCLSKHSTCVEASYWGSNLVSRVGFLEGLLAVLSENGTPDMIIEIGPHPALKGPASQILAFALPGDTGTDIPYIELLSRGRSGIETMAEAIGSLWGYLGPSALDVTSYMRLFEPALKLPRVPVLGLPSYPFNHVKPLTFFRRPVKHHLLKRGPPNILLGSRDPNSADREWRWHNYLKQEILPWLADHRVSTRAVFPATGYIAMALEAASILASTRSRTMRLIQIEDLEIHQAIPIAEDDAVGVETLFQLSSIEDNSKASATTAVFHIDACTATADSLTRRAAGRLSIIWGEATRNTLAAQTETDPAMRPLATDHFYSFLTRMGYGYFGVFKGVQSLLRRKDQAIATISNDISLNEAAASRTHPPPLLHPVVLDTALQALLAALGAPDDGEIYTLLVPVRIKSILINPAFCGVAGTQASGHILSAVGATAKLDADGISGDCDLFTEDGQGIVQMMGVDIAPLHPPAQERRLFAKLVLGPLTPSITWNPPAQPLSPSAASELFEYLERIILLYVKFTAEEWGAEPPENRAELDCHRATIIAWMDRVLTQTRSGKHRVLKNEWLSGTRDDLTHLLAPVAHLAEVRMTATVFANIIPFLRGEKLLLEEVRREDVLTRFYEEDTGMQMMNNVLGELVSQLAFRFPRMRILEIGAGTGAATRAVLRRLKGRCFSYTFSDISVAFFEEAREGGLLAEYEDRMVYKVLDIENDLAEQGFEDGAYDLIIASNVLHATRFMKETMARVRRLLKSGGYLAMQEVTNLDTINTTWSVCGFEGWWAGREDGRIWGPMISREGWDELLRETGFGGIDVYATPGDDEKVCSTSSIIAQAVDDRVRLLREPLSAVPGDSPGPTQLVILGGGETIDPEWAWLEPLVREISSLLKPRFTRVIHATSLKCEELDPAFLFSEGTEVDTVILSLLDIGKDPWLTTLTDETLQSMQTIVRAASKMLWVTVGPETQYPHYGLSRGWLKTLVHECPKSLYQFLNIRDRNQATGDLVATSFMRLVYTDTLNDFRMSTCLHTTEAELYLAEDGIMHIVRLLDDLASNERYTAMRSRVTKDIDGLSETAVRVVGLHNGGHVLREVTGANSNDQSSPKDNTGILVHPRYTTLYALPVARSSSNSPFVHLVVGTDTATGTRLLCLSPTHGYPTPVPSGWSWDIPAGLSEAHEVALLKRVASLVISLYVVQQAEPHSTLLVLGATESLYSAITVQAARRRVRPLFVDIENSSGIIDGMTILPSMMSASTLRHTLPRDISVAVNLSVADDAERSFAQIKEILSPSCIRCLCARDVYRPSALPSPGSFPGDDHDTDPIQHLIKEIKRSTPFILNCSIDVEEPNDTIINARQLSATLSATPRSIIDWRHCASAGVKVPVQIEPAISLVSLSPDRSYLLAGLAGDMGQSLASWMVSKGARHIVLASRTPNVSTTWLAAMAQLGARVTLMSMDLTSRASVSTTFRKIATNHPPLSGIIHGALILDDREFLQTTAKSITSILGPKVLGSMLLDEFSPSTPGPHSLSFFILLGSLAGISGNWSQSAYSAATCFQANLVHARRARGLPGSIVHLGAVSGVGAVARLGADMISHVRATTSSYVLSERDLDRMVAEAIVAGDPRAGAERTAEIVTGCELVPTDEVDAGAASASGGNKAAPTDPSLQRPIYWGYLDYFVRSPSGRTPSSSANPSVDSSTARFQLSSTTSSEEASAILEDAITSKIRSKFNLPEDMSVTSSTCLRDLGMDSLVAVDLRRWFYRDLGVEIPLVDLLNGGSVGELVGMAVASLGVGIVEDGGGEGEGVNGNLGGVKGDGDVGDQG